MTAEEKKEQGLAYKRVIAFALFGYGTTVESGFGFIDYMHGVLINVRLQRMVYPDWIIRLHTDQATYDGFKDLFDRLPIEVVICEAAPMTKAMLWRLMPCYDPDVEYTICRDLDSPLTYREAQAVEVFIREEQSAHAITDSDSHTIEMMGGMIGFWKYFKDYTKTTEWDQLFIGAQEDFTRKGTDQWFLLRRVYPCFAQHGTDSIVQHYLDGMSKTFLRHWYNYIEDVELEGVPVEYKETNDTCGHIGAAGYYVPVVRQLFKKHKDIFTDLEEIEKDYPIIAWWHNEI